MIVRIEGEIPSSGDAVAMLRRTASLIAELLELGLDVDVYGTLEVQARMAVPEPPEEGPDGDEATRLRRHGREDG